MQTLQARFLLALALIGILPLAVVGLSMATLDRRALAEHSARELTGLALGLAGKLAVYLDGLLNEAQAIAALSEVVSLDPVRQGVLLKELCRHYVEFAALSTFDRSGQPLASSQPDLTASIAPRKSLPRTLDHGSQAWETGSHPFTERRSLFIDRPIRDADRRIVGVLGTVVDEEGFQRLALEKAELAERAAESERRYRDPVQGLDAIVWEAAAASLQLSFVSQRAEALLGYTMDQWLTEPDFWTSHLHPDDRERTVARRQAAIAEGQDHEDDYRMVGADGRVVWFRDVRRVVKDPKTGQVQQLRGVMVDITARKQAEPEIQTLNQELEQRVLQRTA